MPKKQTRRPQGEGALYYSESHERYEAAVTLPDGKRKIITSSTKGTKAQKYKEAKAKLEELQKQVAAGTDIVRGAQTLSVYLQEWIPSYKLGVRDTTYTKKQGFFKEITAEFGGYKLKDIRPEMIQKWVTKMSAKYKPSSLKLLYGMFKCILTDAVEQGYLVASPCRGIKLPKVEEEEMTILDLAQRSSFLVQIMGHRYETLFITALTAGMRISEMRGLRWSDVSFSKGKYGEIAVRDNLVFIAHEGYKEHRPKTKAGVRDIPLTELASAKLHKYQLLQKEQYLAAGHSWSEQELVWQGTTVGKPFSDSTIMRDLNRVLALAGLPVIRIHDLRHSAITWWLTCRVQIRTAQKWAGHATIEQTLKYFHALAETVREDLTLFNQSVAEAS
jgi:integrase